MQATPPRSDTRISPKKEVRTSPLEQHDDARGGASAAAAASGKPKSIEYLLVSRFNHMFAVTQELMLMFPREKAGAHRLVCDLQSEIDSLFQSIRTNQATQEEAAKLRDLQLQHAALGSSLAQCIAEKIAMEQLLQKEREEADARLRNAVAQVTANISQEIAQEHKTERDAAAAERVRLLEKISARDDELAAAKRAHSETASKLSEAREEIDATRAAHEQLKRTHDAEYTALRQELLSQRALLESPETLDRQQLVIELEQHQEMALLMSARAERLLHCNRKWLLLRRARSMFSRTFAQWQLACQRAKLLHKTVVSKAHHHHLRSLRSSFAAWFARTQHLKHPTLSSSSLALAHTYLAKMCIISGEMKARLPQEETISQLYGLCKATQGALQPDADDGRRPRAFLPEIDIDDAAADVTDTDEGQTLQRLTGILNDMTAQLLRSQGECEHLRMDALQCRVDADIVRSQLSVLQEQFQVSVAALSDKAHRLQRLTSNTVDGMLRCLDSVTAQFSIQKASAAAAAALDCFVAACVDDKNPEPSKKLKQAMDTLKLAMQNDPHAAELARAVEENRFIAQRLQTLGQSLDGEYELVNRSAAQPTAIQCVSLIERAFAVLRQRGEQVQEGAAAQAAECR